MNPSSSLKINKKKKGVLTSLKLSTDPQSVAARERRHRISDRFKILRSLVPGGNSKMDTVTMLEEAIQYVKFLKAQIWLHQTMINFAETNHDHPNNLIVQPNIFSGLPYNYQQVEGGFNNYFCSGVEVQSVNQLELQDSWFQGEENVAFDATSSLQYGSS